MKNKKIKEIKKKKNRIILKIIVIMAVILFLILVAYIVYITQEREVSFETITWGQYSGIKEGQVKIIKYNFELEKIWEDAFYVIKPMPDMPSINFKNTTVVAFFLGEKQGTGWKINIISVIEKSDRIIISIKQVPPVAYENPEIKTYPFNIIKFKKTEKKILIHIYS